MRLKGSIQNATEGKCKHTSCAVEEERLPAGVLDHHDRSVVVLQAAGDLGRTSLQNRHILRLHCLTPGWRENERERERETDIRIVTQGKRKERTDAGRRNVQFVPHSR